SLYQTKAGIESRMISCSWRWRCRVASMRSRSLSGAERPFRSSLGASAIPFRAGRSVPFNGVLALGAGAPLALRLPNPNRVVDNAPKGHTAPLRAGNRRPGGRAVSAFVEQEARESAQLGGRRQRRQEVAVHDFAVADALGLVEQKRLVAQSETARQIHQ